MIGTGALRAARGTRRSRSRRAASRRAAPGRGSRRARSSASATVPATCVSKPSRSSASASGSVIDCSSSTMRTVGLPGIASDARRDAAAASAAAACTRRSVVVAAAVAGVPQSSSPPPWPEPEWSSSSTAGRSRSGRGSSPSPRSSTDGRRSDRRRRGVLPGRPRRAAWPVQRGSFACSASSHGPEMSTRVGAAVVHRTRCSGGRWHARPRRTGRRCPHRARGPGCPSAASGGRSWSPRALVGCLPRRGGGCLGRPGGGTRLVVATDESSPASTAAYTTAANTPRSRTVMSECHELAHDRRHRRRPPSGGPSPGLGVGKPCSTTLTAMDSQGGAAGPGRRSDAPRFSSAGAPAGGKLLDSTVLAVLAFTGLVPVGGRGARLRRTASVTGPTSRTCRCS